MAGGHEPLSYADEERAIHERLTTNWTTTPIKYGDVPFQQPEAEWIAVWIQNTEARQIDLGVSNPLVRHDGQIVMQVFSPASKGVRLAKQYADTLGAIFAGQQFSAGSSGTIRCRRATVRTLDAKNGWAQVNVEIPFSRDKHL